MKKKIFGIPTYILLFMLILLITYIFLIKTGRIQNTVLGLSASVSSGSGFGGG